MPELTAEDIALLLELTDDWETGVREATRRADMIIATFRTTFEEQKPKLCQELGAAKDADQRRIFAKLEQAIRLKVKLLDIRDRINSNMVFDARAARPTTPNSN